METKDLINARNVLRVALYIRVSSQEQVEGYSIGEQTERLQKYADAMGWDIHKVYVDPGYSGGNMDRPGLKEMIKDIEKGNIDTVVVYKLDRLSRSQFDTLYLIEKVFLTNNTDFVSMTENFNTGTPLGRAMIGFLAVFAQLEKDKINERTIMGKEARAKEGKWGGGSSEPIGYRYDKTLGELVIDDYEAMQIKEAIELFFKGTPLRTISTIFKEKGYTYRGQSGKTSEWEPKRFKYVFASKTYLGYIRYKGEWFKGSHPAIIDEETFERLQKMLEERRETYAKHRRKCEQGHTTYLGGFMYCKQCGGRYHKNPWTTRAKGVYDYRYSCYSRSKKVAKMIKDRNCKNKNWKIDELDNLVFNEIKKLAMDPNYIHELRDHKKRNSDELNKMDIIKNEIKKIDDQISRFMDLYGLGKFTIDQVSGKVDPLNEQKQALEKELEGMNATTEQLSEEETITIVNSFADILESGDINAIRTVLETLIYYIDIDGDDVYIHWKFI